MKQAFFMPLKEVNELCLDNDEPGRITAEAIKYRDYNDQLQAMKGITGKVKTRGDAR